MRLGVAAFAVLVGAGCFPYAVPPANLEVGGGVRTRTPRPATPDEPATLQIRASVDALSLVKSLQWGPVDGSLGYLWYRGYPFPMDGPYAEGVLVLVKWPRDEAEREGRVARTRGCCCGSRGGGSSARCRPAARSGAAAAR